jgi:hypothetical protein
VERNHTVELVDKARSDLLSAGILKKQSTTGVMGSDLLGLATTASRHRTTQDGSGGREGVKDAKKSKEASGHLK